MYQWRGVVTDQFQGFSCKTDIIFFILTNKIVT